MLRFAIRLTKLKQIKGIFLGLLLTTLYACTNRPTETQIQTWLNEADTEEAKLANANQQNVRAQWTLTLAGEISENKIILNWQELERYSYTNILVEGENRTDRNAPENFRGVSVAKLLSLVNIQPKVDEITFVALDAYRSTFKIADLQRYPTIILAVEKSGRPIKATDGGPLQLVYDSFPNRYLNPIYPATYWAYYITHIIVGNEPLRLQVGKRILNQEDLDRLPQNIIRTKVGYRLLWSSESVRLRGVTIRDLLKEANSNVPKQGSIVLRGKASIHRDPLKPVLIPLEVIHDCDVMLAMHFGEDDRLIPTRMGGPLTLVFPPSCKSQVKEQHKWLTFVEEIEIASP
ncbi:molybdopterin-dependent oxidoreductase [Tumidithrix helvetica PCC 7403]|uniref:molybdopterin-dependent oxidoreductase n=1 Tax=Tumidithrix helvetica TaxID=3457545 RepID=UPI003CC22A31